MTTNPAETATLTAPLTSQVTSQVTALLATPLASPLATPLAAPLAAPLHSAAHYFLEGLAELGIEYVFANLGTDHVSLIEELARWDQIGRAHPAFILCPHENVAVHMAAGFAMVTGRGQAVMVHVDAGTANSVMGLHNACRGRTPLMLIAGRAPFTLRGEMAGSRDNYVHFVQDPFDIGSLVRPYVKWEYSLPSGVVAKEALRRGHTLMQSDPPGPVYMTLPREVLAQAMPETAGGSFSAARFGAVQHGGIDPARAQALADQLMAAESPIAVTAYVGRKAEAVRALHDLAELCGIRVFEFSPHFLAIPRSSPCFGGFDAGKALASADVGLLLDVDVPWLPQFTQPNPATHWTHIDMDTVKKDFPMWGFETDVRIQADCATVLAQVAQIVRAQAGSDFHAKVVKRLAAWAASPAGPAARVAATRAVCAPEARGQVGAISAAYACAELGRALAPQDVVVNEAIRNSPAVLQHTARNQPLTLIGGAGGGLGYSGGIALGVKLALTQGKGEAGSAAAGHKSTARVVQIVGDGGFHFSTPTSVYATAQSYGLPIFTVVLDNGGWQAVKEAVLRVYPKGAAAEGNEFQARLQGQQRQFERIAEAFGGYGECARDPAELPAAIARCLAAVDVGRAAVLNVQIGLQ